MGDDVRLSHRTKNTTRTTPDDQRSGDVERGPGVAGRLDEPEGDAEESERDGDHPDDVERPALRVAGLGHGHERDDEPGDRERHVDPEDRGPAEDREEGSPTTGPSPKPRPEMAAHMPKAPARRSTG